MGMFMQSIVAFVRNLSAILMGIHEQLSSKVIILQNKIDF